MSTERDAPLYRDLLRYKPEGLSLNAWAVRAGVNRTVWNDMRRHGNPSRRTLIRLLEVAGSSIAEFEALRIDSPAAAPPSGDALGEFGAGRWGPSPLPPLPLYQCSAATEWRSGPKSLAYWTRAAHAEGLVDRPPSLAGDQSVYAISVADGSMWPRFRQGRILAVSSQAAWGPDDDVLVQVGESGDARRLLVAMLVRGESRQLTLRQFNPDCTDVVAVQHLDAVHRIVGELF